jgi:hypothetical protein
MTDFVERLELAALSTPFQRPVLTTPQIMRAFPTVSAQPFILAIQNQRTLCIRLELMPRVFIFHGGFIIRFLV